MAEKERATSSFSPSMNNTVATAAAAAAALLRLKGGGRWACVN